MDLKMKYVLASHGVPNVSMFTSELTLPKSTVFAGIKWLIQKITPDHLLWDIAPNLGPLISRWEITSFENC